MGIVTEKYHTPRSYIIRTDKDSIIRRNRRHLLPSNNKFEITGEEDDTLINNLTNSKDSTDNNNTDSTITQNEETTNTGSTNSNHEEESNTTNEHRTRSGRLIVKPLRYREKKNYLFILFILT